MMGLAKWSWSLPSSSADNRRPTFRRSLLSCLLSCCRVSSAMVASMWGGFRGEFDREHGEEGRNDACAIFEGFWGLEFIRDDWRNELWIDLKQIPDSGFAQRGDDSKESYWFDTLLNAIGEEGDDEKVGFKGGRETRDMGIQDVGVFGENVGVTGSEEDRGFGVEQPAQKQKQNFNQWGNRRYQYGIHD